MSDKHPGWIFTFGPDHLHPITGESLGKSFIHISDESALRSRMTMLESAFGRAWSSQYELPNNIAERYGLQQIPLISHDDVLIYRVSQLAKQVAPMCDALKTLMISVEQAHAFDQLIRNYVRETTDGSR